ncbi:acetyl-CoA-benzylalcohol acetyltransferase-like [Camellia sinensis]|uniref:Uncharacterized protein n=1 Tax=Camellia sinensis var. sinensis TaxID=542762 RepID=A0A4S4F135_CAMSN|nr:acetyl-CoA-benzylalcohol acetyltransferase-like [Camellia sinensis]XP_028051887.1 acetyl-CoA-benzylalcohol acetyltransferase-like [Camellia sinensis]THG22536.1 hypothetical protein TEA_025069 [Camellia sinensis var. sinensis]
MKVEIQSTNLVKPSIPTPLHLKNYKLSFIDQLASPIHFGILFFFLSDGQQDTDHNPRLCDQLENSLSKTLTRFYPLAGRYSKPDFSVDCGDQGVEVSRARVNGHLSEIVHGRPETRLLDTFVPSIIDLVRPVLRPVLAIQINMFQCGGIALGIRILHSMGDGVSLLTFLQEWADTTRKPLNQPIYYPSFELASLFPGRVLVGLKPEQSSNTVANKKLVTKSFLFDGVTIYALKAEATHPHLGRQPSKVQVLTAYIWRTLIRIARAKHGHPRPSLLSFAMGLRGRIRFLIPEKSYGTLVGHTTALFMAEESEIELGKLVSLLRNSIRKTGEVFAKARDGDEIYAMLIDYYNEIGGDRPREVDLCRFTSWCGFDCYDIDFGWGKPSWVATVSKFVELVFLLDNKCGDGIEAWVTLNEEDMIEFERHYQDLCKHSPVKICSKL